MTTAKLQRILAIALTIAMMVSMMVVFTVLGSADSEGSQYVLNAGTLSSFTNGSMYDGEYVSAGTENYFTLLYSSKTKVEANDKQFSDNVTVSKRIAWGAKTEFGDQITNAVKIKTAGSATVKIWWVGGDAGRNITIFDADGNVVVKDTTATVKNDLYITTLKIPSDGIYYIGNSVGSNYFYQIVVTDSEDGAAPTERADWSTVAAPVITAAADDSLGHVKVNVTGLVGHDGADELVVTMYNANGDKVQTRGSVIEKSEHLLTFAPTDSDTYTFKAELIRADQTKVSAQVNADFLYPLQAPNVSSATSLGGGKIQVKWDAVHEAEAYNIYQDGTKIDTVDATILSYTASGLTLDQSYTFVIAAARGNEEKKSSSISAVASQEEMREWGFTIYGPSTNTASNGYLGSINDDGQVTVYSEGGKGKIQPLSVDGLAFYYTAIPTEYNFTLRARVTVDSWTLSNGQEGFGLLVTDRLGENGNAGNIWNNSYLAGSTKIEYKYDGDNDEIVNFKVVNPDLSKYSMKLGIGVISRVGVTKENLSEFENGDTMTEASNKYFIARQYTLESAATGEKSGTYNIIGNHTGGNPTGSLKDNMLVTEYIMEIQKNNSGYYITHYDLNGNMVMQKKFYDPEALSMLDEDFVYAGFFASRNVRATYSDVELTTILASEDAPREYPPIEYVTPTVAVNSGKYTTNDKYELIVDVNVAGTLKVEYDGEVISSGYALDPNGRYRKVITLNNYDVNSIKIEFTPDPSQVLGEYIELSTTRPIYTTFDVTYNRGNYHRKTVYVSPDVIPHSTTADGTRENPFDIYTALENAYPGQTIILMEGVYKPTGSLKIERGMDGTADAMIRLIADPEAKTRPVIDFGRVDDPDNPVKGYDGFTHAGDYWYFRGFDVTGSAAGQKGFQISGNYNIVDQVNTYNNGNTGLQLSRLSGSDLMEDWPSHNLILNCTSYDNHDPGFEDADGFAAKLTIGEGNVFDGCIAYHNADDGWDLYAKIETGAIGSVTIRNCIAFENGFIPSIPGMTGNGNGFKLGGSSISGKHVLENSIAWGNLAKGIDSNSCPDIIVKDCISFNNGLHNVALYTNDAANTAFVANGIISFRTPEHQNCMAEECTHYTVAEKLTGKGAQIESDYKNDSTYYWNTGSCTSVNTSGVEITADMFVSLVYNIDEILTRNADGTINLHGFLEIKDNVPANVANCKLGGTASYEITLEADEECEFSSSLYNLDKTAHWYVCSCGNKTAVEEHNLIWIIDKQISGSTPGMKHQQCTECGYKSAKILMYPDEVETPVEPEQPDQPTQPEQPEQPETPTDGEQLGFFARIWQAILNFFRKLFGLSSEAYLPRPHRLY